MQANLVTLLGLDTVREKTLYQARWLHDHGFEVHILTLHRDAGSIRDDPAASIEPIVGGPIARIRQIVRHLRSARGPLHHVELYVGGRFAFVYALICRLARVRLVAVERGDLLQCQRRAYPLSARLSTYACYRLAHRVWLREPYMLPAFARWRVRRTFFLPNAVPMPEGGEDGGERSVDFLWANRLVPERHPDWFAAALVRIAERRSVSAELLGFSATARPTSDLEGRVRAAVESLPGVHCEPFGDPHPAYRRARFFVLPADVVFANFALLESMANGAVPIVSDVEGAERIVSPGENGLLVRHDPAALERAMDEALDLSGPEWKRLSDAARATIAERFSIDRWGRDLLRHYEEAVA